MPAYVILDINIHDPARYEDYKRLGAPTVAAFGGRYVVRGGAAETLEGEWRPGRLVVLEFPSAARAREWYDSEAYRAARDIRQASARTDAVVVEGI